MGSEIAQIMREASGPVQTHVQAVLAVGAGGKFVVRPGGLELQVGIELSDVRQPAVRQTPETGDTFVPGVVVFKVVTLQVLAPLTPVIGGREKDPGVFLSALGNQQRAAPHSHRLVDQSRGRRPKVRVERGFVQRRQKALECVSFAHNPSLSHATPACPASA